MVLPQDMPAMLALRTLEKIERVAPEFPGETTVEYAGTGGKGTGSSKHVRETRRR